MASRPVGFNTPLGSKERAKSRKIKKKRKKTQYSENVKKNGISTVNVSKVVELQKEPFKIFDPNHPLADGDGYIYKAPINVEEEMVDMMDASRQYQNNIEVVTTLKALTLKTINLGK